MSLRNQVKGVTAAYEIVDAGGSMLQALQALELAGGDPNDIMEYKSAPAEFKADGDQGEYRGHFAVFGNVDDGGDVSHPGMFKKTIQERGDRVKVFYAHDWMKLLGPTPDTLKEDSVGLFAGGRLTLKSFWGNEVWQLMKDGALNEGSFGYRTVNSEIEEDGARHLYEVSLYEISPVPLGMNALTSVQAVKAMISRKSGGAIPPHDAPAGDPEKDWAPLDAKSAHDLRKVHAWANPDADPNDPGSYALRHHHADGSLSWDHLKLAADLVMGFSLRPSPSRPWSAVDEKGIMDHLEHHFAEYDEAAPWKASGVTAEVARLDAFLTALRNDEALVTSEPVRVKHLIDALDGLLSDLKSQAVEPSGAHSTLQTLAVRARSAEIALRLATNSNGG